VDLADSDLSVRTLLFVTLGDSGAPDRSTVGEVGESTSLDPLCESFVRFFFRNPSDGMERGRLAGMLEEGDGDANAVVAWRRHGEEKSEEQADRPAKQNG
jgi:hypothetical protein